MKQQDILLSIQILYTGSKVPYLRLPDSLCNLNLTHIQRKARLTHNHVKLRHCSAQLVFRFYFQHHARKYTIYSTEWQLRDG